VHGKVHREGRDDVVNDTQPDAPLPCNRDPGEGGPTRWNFSSPDVQQRFFVCLFVLTKGLVFRALVGTAGNKAPGEAPATERLYITPASLTRHAGLQPGLKLAGLNRSIWYHGNIVKLLHTFLS